MAQAQDTATIAPLRIRAQMEREAEELLRAEGIAPALAEPAQKCGEGSVGTVEVSTNVHGMQFKQEIPVYRYDVKVTGTIRKLDGSEKIVELTKKFAGDAVAIDHHDRCRDVFHAFQKTNKAFLKDSNAVYYDLQSIMYSLNRLDVPQEGAANFKILSTDLPSSFSHFSHCDLDIRRVTNDFELTIGIMRRSLGRNLEINDHSLLQFLDLATSQHILFQPEKYVSLSATKSFLLDPPLYDFTADDTAFFPDNGAYLALGVQKSIRFMEGRRKTGSTALILESKKTPFHAVESLLEKVQRMVNNIHDLSNSDFTKIEKICTGLCVETRHLKRSNKFYIKSLDNESASRRLIFVDGQEMSVEHYFLQKYKIKLVEPNIPLLRARGINNTVCYVPIELCYVCDNQRVKINQQTSSQVQETIKKCAIPPATLLRHNLQAFRSMEFDSSEYLKNAGITVINTHVKVGATSLESPMLEYSNHASSSVRTDNFTWPNKSYLIPARFPKWVAYAFLSNRDRLGKDDFEKFVSNYMNECQNRGMVVPNPEKVDLFGTSDVKVLEKEIKAAGERGCEFALIIHPEHADDMHSFLKLNERLYSVVTQAIRFNTLRNMIVKGQPLTLQNIVNKTNIKLGGLNYSLRLTSPGAKDVLGNQTLYIGFGMNHPSGGLGTQFEEANAIALGEGVKVPPPSIVGYAANVGLVDEFEFVGDFIFQPPLRDEKAAVIRTIVQRCVDKFRANRKYEPKQIVLFRNGCSEGNFPMVLRLEVPLIKNALEKLNCKAKLVVIVPNKLQSIRFIPSNVNAAARPVDQNVKPGLVVDHSIVHPVLCEFFLNSHRALQGTARTPKYTVLVNDCGYLLTDIERITYALCYGHQIVMMPTSLPSPVFIALRYAERGRKLYNAWHLASDSDHSKINYETMSEQLGYFGNESLANRRINA